MLQDPRRPTFTLTWVAVEKLVGLYHRDVSIIHHCWYPGYLSFSLAVALSVALLCFVDLSVCCRATYRSEQKGKEVGGDGWGEVEGEKIRNLVRSRDLQCTISHSFPHLVCHLCYLATFQTDCTRLLLLSALFPHSHPTDDKCRLSLIRSELKIQAQYLENI